MECEQKGCTHFGGQNSKSWYQSTYMHSLSPTAVWLVMSQVVTVSAVCVLEERHCTARVQTFLHGRATQPLRLLITLGRKNTIWSPWPGIPKIIALYTYTWKEVVQMPLRLLSHQGWGYDLVGRLAIQAQSGNLCTSIKGQVFLAL